MLLCTFIVVTIIFCYLVFRSDNNSCEEHQKNLLENRKIILRAHRENWGDFVTPYKLEWKEENSNNWNLLCAFQEKDGHHDISSITINDSHDLEKWKEQLKTLQDIRDFQRRQQEIEDLWYNKETDKNCIY